MTEEHNQGPRTVENYHDVINVARQRLAEYSGQTFDILSLARPDSITSLHNLAKIISKLSPLMGNLLEFKTIDIFNEMPEFSNVGTWERQDPGFPDTIFRSNFEYMAGFEIKAWFPFATEITARFKDSQNRFIHDETYVALIAWLPEYVLWGRPKVIDVCVASGASIALARDTHYHNPPDYIIFEPEDTAERTQNLQQTNTNGYKLQEASQTRRELAENIVAQWGENGRVYAPSAEYQQRLRELQGQFTYRLDTNYAKIDRIEHAGIENFKSNVMRSRFLTHTIREWVHVFKRWNEIEHLDENDPDALSILHADRR